MGRKVFLLGGANTPFIGKGHPDFIWKRHPEYGSRENPTIHELIASAADKASVECRVAFDAVDQGFIGNFLGELFVSQGHLGAALAGANGGLEGTPMMRVEGACASGGLAALCGAQAIAAGADVVLVAGAEVQTTTSARVGGDYLARAAHYERQRPLDDFTFPAIFADRTRHYREAFGVSEADIGLAAVKAYANANRNELAHMNTRKMDAETASAASETNPNFLSNPECAEYLKVSDCSQVSDGASALFLVSEEGLSKVGASAADAIELVGTGSATASLYTDGSRTALETTALAANRAYQAAGLEASDVDVAEVHDCFTIAEVLMYEALGFAAPGEGTRLLREGRTEISGDLPVNTGGGLVGFGHPVGATGVKQMIEIWRQMKGRCGAYQVSGNMNVGLTANMGGDDKSVVVGMFRNVEG